MKTGESSRNISLNLVNELAFSWFVAEEYSMTF